MYRHFSEEFFIGNRARLRELFVGTAPIVITANGVLQRNADTTFAFRQDSSFWYLTGIQQPDITLVIDKSKEYLIMPAQQDYLDIFHGGNNAQGLQAVSGVKTVYKHEEGWRQLHTRIKKAKHLATLSAGSPYVEQLGFYVNPARAQLIERVKQANPEIELLDLRPQMTAMRMVKQAPELAALQEAINLTVASLKSVQRRQFHYEYEIEAELNRAFRKTGAVGHGFAPIVAAGHNACIVHHFENNGVIGARDLLTLDVGAEVENYTADITRTYSQAKNPTRRQRAVHAAVMAVQEYAFSLMAPGALIKDNETKVEHFMGEKLRELGLIKTIDRDTVRAFYPHATSHHLGLDAHDAADYSRPLEPGMVLTVEPGIYIPEEGIGVRIEDDVLITADGFKNLSARLPREIC